MTPRVVAPAASPDSAATVPGIADANEAIIAESDNAGTHRTRASTDRPFACEPTSRRGTIAPRATTRTPSRATRASQRTLGPRPFPSRSALIAISHPSASFTWIDKASAETPSPNRMPGWTDQPCDGPPHISRRVANSSFDAGIAPRPPAQTTKVPADHDACSTTSSGGRSASAALAGRSRSAVLRKLPTVSVKSATTCSRSSPERSRAEARPSSASPTRRASSDNDVAPPSRKSATSSSLPRPSAIRQIALSSCVMSTIDLRPPPTNATARQSPRQHSAIGHLRRAEPQRQLRNTSPATSCPPHQGLYRGSRVPCSKTSLPTRRCVQPASASPVRRATRSMLWSAQSCRGFEAHPIGTSELSSRTTPTSTSSNLANSAIER